ncbi:MAG: NAD(P)/FAD-dependent oxidoreductase [Alphaproteobacteria bacterium]|nr:NAD(P)/FAD-dependent oxidoreductase [Alphaproteobacteria bacterium]
MPTRSFDVVILGGGNAGMGVTVAARQAGLKVAMIEPDLLGGTCPNRGCMPKKVLVAAAHALDEIERAKAHHITVGRPSLDWAALIDREKAMIRDIPGSLADAMARRGVEVIRDRGCFAGPNAVALAGEVLEAKHIVIATGSKPRRLPFPGAELMVTSDDVLNERSLPASVVFVGGGVIALEFSHVYARAGARVTILEMLPRLLANMDTDAVSQLHSRTERLGVAVHAGIEIQRIERAGDGLRVSYVEDGSEHAVEADRVVHGAGRIADLDGLKLSAGRVASERGEIALDAHLRSISNTSVYACGDAVATSPQLSPIATYEGRIVGRNIVEGPRHTPEYASIPACVFTVPALASVGLTQAAAEEQGIDLRVEVNDMRNWLSGRTYAETAAWAKVLIDKHSDRIVGAHILGHAGEELIHIFALAMKHGITAGDIKELVYGFPTFSADIKSLW